MNKLPIPPNFPSQLRMALASIRNSDNVNAEWEADCLGSAVYAQLWRDEIKTMCLLHCESAGGDVMTVDWEKMHDNPAYYQAMDNAEMCAAAFRKALE